MSRYKFNKFKRGDKVMTPDGEGTVTEVQYMDGKHWYSTREHSGFYREDELKATKRKGD